MSNLETKIIKCSELKVDDILEYEGYSNDYDPNNPEQYKFEVVISVEPFGKSHIKLRTFNFSTCKDCVWDEFLFPIYPKVDKYVTKITDVRIKDLIKLRYENMCKKVDESISKNVEKMEQLINTIKNQNTQLEYSKHRLSQLCEGLISND